MAALLRPALVALQVLTFLGLTGVLASEGQWRLAGAQLLLAGVTGLVYL